MGAFDKKAEGEQVSGALDSANNSSSYMGAHSDGAILHTNDVLFQHNNIDDIRPNLLPPLHAPLNL